MSDTRRQLTQQERLLWSGLGFVLLAMLFALPVLWRPGGDGNVAVILIWATLPLVLAVLAFVRYRKGSDSLPWNLERFRGALTYALGIQVTISIIWLLVIGTARLMAWLY